MKQSFAVFGIGRFGRSVAMTLMNAGASVMVVDNDEDLVERIANDVTYAVKADVTDPVALEGLGITNMDAVIVAMAQELEATILSVITLKELGIPKVIAKARDHRMGEILERVGADQVIYPEEEMGVQTARKLLSSDFLEFFDLSEELCLVELKPKKEWVGKSLKELNLRKKYNCNVIALKDNDVLTSALDPDAPIRADITLLITVEHKDLNKLV